MQESRETSENSLKRTLGPINLTMLGSRRDYRSRPVRETAAGHGAHHAGLGLTLAFIVAGFGCAFAGLCYAEFASMIPLAGSAYTYSYATMGEICRLDYRLGSRAGIRHRCQPRCRRAWSNHFMELLDIFHIKMPLWLAYDHWTGLVPRRMLSLTNGKSSIRHW